MVVPYPERFQWKHVAVFAAVILIAQLVEGTNVFFAALLSVYICLCAGAFNIAGGLMYSSGSFILFNGALVVIVGLTYKLFLNEPGESHLLSPILTMLVECVGMFAMGCVAILVKKLRSKPGYMANIARGEEMKRAAIGALILGLALPVVFGSGLGAAGSIGSAVHQINKFLPLALLLSTTYQVKKTHGRSGFNWIVIALLVIMFAGGVIYSSKEGMFEGPVTWLLSAWAAGYNFRARQVLFGAIFAWVMVYYMIPYSQYVRSFRDSGGNEAANTKVAKEYIFKLNEVHSLTLEARKDAENEEIYQVIPRLYDHDQGIVSRLSMLPWDDALVTLTDQGTSFGLYPLLNAYLNIVPHFLWADKPTFFAANVYGHEIGVLAEEDFTTGISFSSMGDSFREAGWFGIACIFPVVMFMYFMVMDSLTGSIKSSPWPLLAIVLNAHLGPEGLLDTVVQQTTVGAFSFLVLALAVKYLIPFIYNFFAQRDTSRSRPVIDFKLGQDPLVRPLSGRLGPGA